MRRSRNSGAVPAPGCSRQDRPAYQGRRLPANESSHECPLGRVVVDEHERIELQFQPLGDRPQVVGLVLPIGHEARECRDSFENHVVALIERLAGFFVVVLRANGEHDSPLLEFLGIALKCEEGFAFAGALPELDAAGPQVADNSAPQRVVQVEHQDLLARAEHGPQQADDAVRVGDQALRTAGHFEFEIKPRIEPARSPGLGGKPA